MRDEQGGSKKELNFTQFGTGRYQNFVGHLLWEMRICWTSQCHKSVNLLLPNADVHKLSNTFSCKKCAFLRKGINMVNTFSSSHDWWLRINKTENERTPTRKLSRGITRKRYADYWGGQWKFQQYFDTNWLSRLASASNSMKREISSYLTCIIEWYACIQWVPTHVF